MNRVRQFAFRVTNEERRAIADLAASLHRSQSDAVRLVVLSAARNLVAIPSCGTDCKESSEPANVFTPS